MVIGPEYGWKRAMKEVGGSGQRVIPLREKEKQVRAEMYASEEKERKKYEQQQKRKKEAEDNIELAAELAAKELEKKEQ